MRIEKKLYFAPGIKFSELDFSDSLRIVNQFNKRIYGYYLDPAKILLESKNAFAGGLLLVSAIDALSLFIFDKKKVKTRFIKFCNEYLFYKFDEPISNLFFDDFRNGLVHEARIKNGGEFSFTENSIAIIHLDSPTLIINPEYLYHEIESALSKYINTLKKDIEVRKKLNRRLKNLFKYELSD